MHALIVAQQSNIGTEIEELLSSEFRFRCEVVRWDSIKNARLGFQAAGLVVAVTDGAEDILQDFFAGLSRDPLSAPLCVVIVDNSPLDGAPSAPARLAARTADEFILYPFRKQELVQRIGSLLRHTDNHRKADVESTDSIKVPLIGQAPSFRRVVEQMPFIARSDAPVLILGETGTGKEVCARAIHALSGRRNHPFVPFDCCSVPEHLFENELFGHCRGAYTDAHSDQRGLVAQAENGTLLLDEIDSLSLAAQAKLLRFLQEGTYRPLGSECLVPANVRVITATNANLETFVQQKRFRSDLYFRLNVLRLELPSLRERKGDVSLLAEHFLSSLCRAAQHEKLVLSPGALRLLENYDWPGNIRELYNVVQRLAVFSPGPQILAPEIPWATAQARCDESPVSFREGRTQAIANFERDYIMKLLRKHQGNVSCSAREAGKDRRTFGRLIKKYNIQRLDLN